MLASNNSLANSGNFDFLLDENFQYLNIAPFVEVYGDTTFTQDFDFVLKNSNQLDFQINDRKGLHKGVADAIYWIKMPLQNMTRVNKEYILHIRNPDIHGLQFFVVKKDTIEKSIYTGDYVPFKQRPILHSQFLFPFQLSPQEQVECYLMVDKRDQYLIMNLELWEKQYFIESDSNRSIAYGILVGLILLYLSIQLLLFSIFRYKILFYYFILTFCLFLLIINKEGLGFQYIWSYGPQEIYDLARSFLGLIQVLLLIILGIEFYSKSDTHRTSINILKWGWKITLISIPFSWILYKFFLGNPFVKPLLVVLYSLQVIILNVFLIILFTIAFHKFFQKKKYEDFVLGLITILYFIIYWVMSLYLVGLINAGPNIELLILSFFMVEISLTVVLFISKYQSIGKQSIRLKFAKSKQELEIAKVLLKGQEIERSRIANSLQVGLQGIITKNQEVLNQDLLKQSNPLLLKIEDLLTQSQKEIKRIHSNLMPNIIYEKGLIEGIQSICQTVDRTDILNVEFKHNNIENEFSDLHKMNIYSIIQELLNNVVKHAHAQYVEIRLEQKGNQLLISSDDDGKGLGRDEKEISIKTKTEFLALKNRTSLLNGNISFTKSRLSGLKVEIKIPI